MAVITVWSDLFCPWAYVAGLRLRRIREELGPDRVAFDFRAWPLDVAFRPTDPSRRRAETVALAQHEPGAFTLYEGAWPQSSVLAWEAQKWAYTLGQDLGERFDLALRRAFFLHTRNLAYRQEILGVAESEGLDADDLARALDSGVYRVAVAEDVAAGRAVPVGGSPTVVLPDGSTYLNPGFTVNRVRDIPIITADHAGAYRVLVTQAIDAE